MKTIAIQYTDIQYTDNRFLMLFVGLIFLFFVCFYAYLVTYTYNPINYSTGVKEVSDGLLLSPWAKDTISWKGW